MNKKEHGGSFQKNRTDAQKRTIMMYIGPNSRNSIPDDDPALDHLINALRGEMLQYSGLLVMLREQEKHILKHHPADLVASTGQMSAQLNKVATARDERESRMNEYITELDHAVNSRQLTGSSLGIRRKLLASLIEQINHLLREIQEHLQRNHDLLKNSLAPMQHILDRIVWN